jgi:hypothetical protein
VWAGFFFTTEGTVFFKVSEMPNPSSGGECIKSHSPLDFPDFGGDFFPPEVFPFEVVSSEEWHLD